MLYAREKQVPAVCTCGLSIRAASLLCGSQRVVPEARKADGLLDATESHARLCARLQQRYARQRATHQSSHLRFELQEYVRDQAYNLRLTHTHKVVKQNLLDAGLQKWAVSACR